MAGYALVETAHPTSTRRHKAWPKIAGAASLLFIVSAPATASRALAAGPSPSASAVSRFNPVLATSSSHPCGTTFNAIIVPAADWDSKLPPNSGHDGATYDVRSNYNASRGYYNSSGTWVSSPCAGDILSTDPSNAFGREYQCTELVMRVADGEWSIGGESAWHNAGWNGSADSLGSIGPKLGLTWVKNGSGTLPPPGALMVWGSGGGSDPGHAAVVSSSNSTTVTFVGENQGDGMVVLSVSGSTVENNGWKSGSTILGWLDLPTYPNGSFIQVPNGTIYRIAGGAPLALNNCTPIPGSCTSVHQVASLTGYLSVPRDGTFVQGEPSGTIYRFAGGAPLALTSCPPGGCGSPVFIDQWTVDELDHMNSVPTNGTFLQAWDSGTIYRIAGGAPLALTNCLSLPGGCGSPVFIDQWTVDHLNHLNAVPTDGTFLQGWDSRTIFRVAGGAALPLTSCTAIAGGCGYPVFIDQWTVDHLNHLNAVPTDGTILEGMPSATFWLIAADLRSSVPPPEPTAVQVDDSTVYLFTLAP
jgi:CHAP domain